MGGSDRDGVGRRRALECMAWAGGGVLWTVVGGVPRSALLGGGAQAATPSGGLSFVQISDSHIGFHNPPNPDTPARSPLRSQGEPHQGRRGPHDPHRRREPPLRRHAVRHRGPDHPRRRAGDALRPRRARRADRQRARLLRPLRQGREHGRLVQLRPERGAFHRPEQRAGSEGWRHGRARGAQLEWLERDLAHRPASQPIVVFAHIPLWIVYEKWGWGTSDGAQALGYLRRFGSVTVLNGHIHQVIQKVEGTISCHTALSTAFPQPAPGTAAVAWADEGADRAAAYVPRHHRRARDPRPAAARGGRHHAGGLSGEGKNMHRILLATILLAAAAPHADAADAAVTISNFTFAPQVLTVPAGTGWYGRTATTRRILLPGRRPLRCGRSLWIPAIVTASCLRRGAPSAISVPCTR